MNIRYQTDEVEQKIADAKLTAAYNRMMKLILDAGDITNETTGKGVLPLNGGVKAVSLIPTKYFLVDTYESALIPGIRVFCVFDFVDSENDDIPGGQLKRYLQTNFGEGCPKSRKNQVSDEDLAAFAREYMSEDDVVPDPEQKPELKCDYIDWLRHQDATCLLGGEHDSACRPLFVRETKRWSTSYRDSANEAGRWLNSIYKKISTIFYDENEDALLAGTDETVCRLSGNFDDGCYLISLSPWNILCRYQMIAPLEVSDSLSKKKEVQCRILTLIEFWNGNDQQRQTPEQKWNSYYENYEKRRCRAFRCYPGRIFDDSASAFERWDAMERKDKPVCIEFSTEELNIIFGAQRKLPILINGAAGSGKSTALYWLFAAYWITSQNDHRKFLEGGCQMRGKPIFLTLSSALCNQAVQSVVDIIRFSSGYVQGPGQVEETELRNSLSDCMWSFDFVLSEILGDMDDDYGDKDKEIVFETFKTLLLGDARLGTELYRDRFKGFLNKKYTPELCWHIIRCYIKGVPGRDQYDREKFEKFLNDRRESNDIFVDKDTCLCVWDEIWPWYRGLWERGYWDQQDRVTRAMSRLEARKGELPESLRDIGAVFCDEVQDFTGVEQSLIMRLSSLLHFRMPQGESYELPFAFAGDPMQTLNPSGFRWEDLKRDLTDNMTKTGAHFRIEHFPLERNYRSPVKIVRLANMIELTRKMLFGDKVYPQTPDKKYDGEICLTTRASGADVSEDEVRQLENCMILLPCSQGAKVKKDFIEDHPFLRKLSEKGFSKDCMLSVLDAKGMDIARVVLYNFGDSLFCDDSIPEFPDCTDGSCKDISFSYALNKVYVGITRTTDKLGIIDTERGINRFWGKIGSDDWRQRYLASLDAEAAREATETRDVWAASNLPDENICDYLQDNLYGDTNLNQMSEEELIDEAYGWFENAYFVGNPRQMMMAAQRFNHFPQMRRHMSVSRGFADKYEHEYKRAAKHFSEAIDINSGLKPVVFGQLEIVPAHERIECLWVSMDGWREIADDEYAKMYKKGVYFRIAQIMLSGELTPADIVNILQLSKLVDSEMRRSEQWHMCLDKVSHNVIQLCGRSEFDPDVSKLLYEEGLFREFADFLCTCFGERSTLRVCGQAAMRIYVALEDWKGAYALSQKYGEDIRGVESECNMARARCADWPDYAIAAHACGQYLLCAERWVKEHREKDELQLKAYAPAVQQGFIDDLLEAASANANVSSRQELQQEAVRIALSIGQWRFICDGRHAVLLDNSQKTECMRTALAASEPDWALASKLLQETIADCLSANDIDHVLNSIASVPVVFLKSAGAGVFVKQLRLSLTDRKVRSIWPQREADMRVAADVFVKIGMMQEAEDFSKQILKDDGFRKYEEVREVAMELYLYARRDFINNRCSSARRNYELGNSRRFFVETFMPNADPRVAEQRFDSYWDSVATFSFESVVQTKVKASVESCVVGAKVDEKSGFPMLTCYPIVVIDKSVTEGKIHITNIEALERAVFDPNGGDYAEVKSMNFDVSADGSTLRLVYRKWETPHEIVIKLKR